ncbi:BMP family ABC transporter substrate-binding protein [Halobacillus sp. A1]|uniref:BMP family lipoprotein n=1 Tax=Halobacillus sp. A1 TaxID=2880262 RepID=UPI0020A6D643|nr:BMP family ABC transporter substrate-binding protein [Halobacillus sp. A1]MCP3031253.1 BMP family ABC transporter substrate-binding protein [Halobacillus sp. A1]
MKNRRFLLMLALLLSIGFVLAACGSSDDGESSGDGGDSEGSSEDGEESSEDFSVAMVTDVGGVDDKSFNQSSWEGLQAFGEENGLEEGEGYDYAQSDSEGDYTTNISRLVRQDYDLIYGIGYLLQPALEEVAEQNPDTNFGLVDSVSEVENIVSITFKEQEGSFLAGVAAALKTETDKIGFVGGEDGSLIRKFESGYVAGAKSINPDIEIDIQYAESFAAADKGKLIASDMYNNDIDVIYHASGATGNGVFAQAKDIKQNNPDEQVWVIGVDRDQHEEGAIGDDNVTLTSMVKRVDVAVNEIATQTMEGDFPGGEVVEYGLEDDAISIAQTNEDAMTEDILSEIESWKEQISNGDITVPSTDEELEEYESSL